MFLVRDLVSPRTWLAMIHHLAGLFIGIVAVVVITVGLSVGFSLLVLALVGLPLLGMTLRFADWFAYAGAGPVRVSARRADLGLAGAEAGPGTAGVSCRAGGC